MTLPLTDHLCLCAMLDGEPPFASLNGRALLHAKLTQTEPEPTQLEGLTSHEQASLVMLYRGMMQKDPTRRVAAWACVETIGRIIFRPTWRLKYFNIKTDAAADRFFSVTSIGVTAPENAGSVYDYEDPHEAFAEAIALLFEGLGASFTLRKKPLLAPKKLPVSLRLRPRPIL